MKLFNQITERVNEQFTSAKLTGAGNKAPRTGYYFIKSVAFEPVGPTGQVLIAQANWKKNQQDYFLEDFIISVAISNLMFDSAEHPPLIENEELIGKTLFVYNPVFDVKHFNGVPKQVIKAKCHYVNESPRFINEANAALLSLSKNDNDGKTAYQKLIENSSYDFDGSLEIEAERGNKHDALINEYVFQIEDYTEDTADNDASDAQDDDKEENENPEQ